jgi:poly(beta-D-mannuronate) C5 epimerase
MLRTPQAMKYAGTALCAIAVYSLVNVGIVHASPTSCPAASLRWAGSSDTLYIDGRSTVCTPADLNAARPAQVVSVSTGVYLVRSNITLTDGATLQATGTAAGGDTNELRLLSGNAPASFAAILADWGEVELRNVTVTSWDEAVNGPDTNVTNGRAFIDVRSRYKDGVALTSRMDIVNSDVGYLGYHSSEAYGLTWKVAGSTPTDKSVLSHVTVVGAVTGSHVHNNYFGMYTYGAYGMNIDSDEFDRNVGYGIDIHDKSSYLVITNTSSHDNGNHGIISSESCDHLTIAGDRSYDNAGHGIMFHRSTDYSAISENMVTNNTEAGIALLESNNNIITGNIIGDNPYGIRLSVGSSYNTFQNNYISDSRLYGIHTYEGNDAPERPFNRGINSYNTWTGNVVENSGSNILKLGATDYDIFAGNDFRNNPGADFDLAGAVNTTFRGNLTAPPAAR